MIEDDIGVKSLVCYKPQILDASLSMESIYVRLSGQ